MNTFCRTMAFGLVALLAGFGPAITDSRADFAYGVTYFDNQLISVNTTTGVGSLVGTLDAAMSPFGLSYGGGNLYTFDSNAGLIKQINTTTAATQQAYNIGLSPGGLLGQGGLAFQNSNVGFLTSALSPTDYSTVNDLYKFNLATGTSTLVAHTADTLQALAFSAAGVLYGMGKNDGNLYTIDTNTGAMTLIGNVGIPIGSPTGGLAFGPGGMLYATLDDILYTVNPTTAQATVVNPDPTAFGGFNSVSGLAVAPLAAVPEPSSMALCGIFLAAAGGRALLRRRKSA